MKITSNSLTRILIPDKSDETPVSLSWHPKHQYPPAEQLYVEGRWLSSVAGDRHVVFAYDAGGSCQTEDTAQATVSGQPPSNGTLLLYKVDPAHGSLGPEDFERSMQRYHPVGDRAVVVFKVKVGAGERIDPSIDSVTLRIEDTYDYPEHVDAI